MSDQQPVKQQVVGRQAVSCPSAAVFGPFELQPMQIRGDLNELVGTITVLKRNLDAKLRLNSEDRCLLEKVRLTWFAERCRTQLKDMKVNSIRCITQKAAPDLDLPPFFYGKLRVKVLQKEYTV